MFTFLFFIFYELERKFRGKARDQIECPLLDMAPVMRKKNFVGEIKNTSP